MAICEQFLIKVCAFSPPTDTKKLPFFRCKFSISTVAGTEPEPVCTSVKTFAPATVANLGPGYDILGCAVDGVGDVVTASIDPCVTPGEVVIADISGTRGSEKLSKNPLSNCVGIAAMTTMKMLSICSVGLSISLEKGIPLGSGLGSSAASAAAAAVAVNGVFGGKLSTQDLIVAGLKSEAAVSGYHADNIAPAIMGGFVLISRYDPLELMRVKLPENTELLFVLVTPVFEAPTKKMRAVLPSVIGMKEHVWNSGQVGALLVSAMEGDLVGFGKALSSDKIVEPARSPLIPGMEAVKKAAMAAGAFGCAISGAGPTAVAVIDCEERGRAIGEKMVEAFSNEGNLNAMAMVKSLDRVGARIVHRVRK